MGGELWWEAVFSDLIHHLRNPVYVMPSTIQVQPFTRTHNWNRNAIVFLLGAIYSVFYSTLLQNAGCDTLNGFWTEGAACVKQHSEWNPGQGLLNLSLQKERLQKLLWKQCDIVYRRKEVRDDGVGIGYGTGWLAIFSHLVKSQEDAAFSCSMLRRSEMSPRKA